MTDKKLLGRPTSLTLEIGTEICDRLVRIGSLRTVCSDEEMPSKSAVFRWLLKAEIKDCDVIYTDFRDQYARARQLSKDYKFDELEHTLKKLAVVEVEDENKGTVKAMTSQSVAFAKLHLDAFKWQAGKENPKKYGDKVEHDVSGSLVINLTDKDSQA